MKRLIKSFGYAGQGLMHCIKKEKNFQVHCIAAVAAFAGGFILKISPAEWMVVVICMALVLAFEMANTAIEHLCNITQPAVNPAIKIIKDVSASAVMLIAVMAAICGFIIFIPKIIVCFQNS
jgi:diacylglycerol kinase